MWPVKKREGEEQKQSQQTKGCLVTSLWRADPWAQKVTSPVSCSESVLYSQGVEGMHVPCRLAEGLIRAEVFLEAEDFS